MPLKCILCNSTIKGFDRKDHDSERGREYNKFVVSQHLINHHRITENMPFFHFIHFLPTEEKSKLLDQGKEKTEHENISNPKSKDEFPLTSAAGGKFHGPFPVPMKDMADGRTFKEHNEFTHKNDTNCAEYDSCGQIQKHREWDEINIAGPASEKKTGGIIYTCNRNDCKIPCSCRICKNGFCRTKCNEQRDCEFCDSQCQDHKVGLQRTFEEETGIKSAFASTNTYFPNIDINACAHCKTDFQDHEKFHTVIHTRCKYCESRSIFLNNSIDRLEAFRKKKNIQNYEKRICQFCCKRFKTTQNRIFHESRCGKCIHCGQQFTTATETEDHENTCDARKELPNALKRKHVESDNQNTENSKKEIKLTEFKCPICDESFSGLRAKSNLQRHIESIHEEDSFSCDECDAAFTRKDKLKEHREHVHSESNIKYDYSYTKYPNRKPHSCNQCESSFDRKDSLDYHMKTAHSEGKFTCDYCQKPFKSKQIKTRHMEKCSSNK
jgi:hypothetical protein